MPEHAALTDRLSAQLQPRARALLDAVVGLADSRGLRAFLVGGTVRDLLLGRNSLDVDVAIEGDAVALAREVASATGARLAKTTAFGTATVVSGSFHLDLVTTRSETYAHPGALPKVHPSTIDDDLVRRDFTINAMALQLNGAAPGKLLDPAGGEADLRAGLVRVIHDGSFRDDATRILRAARYEARFGFRLEEATADLLGRDLSYLDRISGTRIRQELQRTFQESEPERALLRLEKLGALAAIHPGLSFPEASAEAFPRLRKLGAPPLAGWPLLCLASDAGRRPEIVRRLALTKAQREVVLGLAGIDGPALAQAERPSQVAHLLDPLPLPAVYAFAAAAASDPGGAIPPRVAACAGAPSRGRRRRPRCRAGPGRRRGVTGAAGGQAGRRSGDSRR